MSEKRTDHLAEKIRRRRLGETGPGVVEQGARPNVSFPTLSEIQCELADLRASVEAARGRPLEVARLLGEAVAQGREPLEIANAFGVARTWVAKRLTLNNAPLDVRAQIEAGTLAETKWYNHRSKVLAELKRETKDQDHKRRRRKGEPYALHPSVSISEPVARATAHLLAHLALTLKLAPIDVDGATLRGLRTTLELRAPELWDAIKKSL